jgi:hypothetical protein
METILSSQSPSCRQHTPPCSPGDNRSFPTICPLLGRGRSFWPRLTAPKLHDMQGGISTFKTPCRNLCHDRIRDTQQG